MDFLARLLDSLQPIILELLDYLIAIAIAWAALRFKQWTGVEIEKKMQDDLHRAAMTGARDAVARGLQGIKASEFVEGYMKESVPEAMARLKPSPVVLQTIARTKLAEVAGG